MFARRAPRNKCAKAAMTRRSTDCPGAGRGFLGLKPSAASPARSLPDRKYFQSRAAARLLGRDAPPRPARCRRYARHADALRTLGIALKQDGGVTVVTGAAARFGHRPNCSATPAPLRADRGAGAQRWRLSPVGRGAHHERRSASGRRLAPTRRRHRLPGPGGIAAAHQAGADKYERKGERARRRVQPVPDRAVDGIAAHRRQTTIAVEGEPISKPYVEIALNLMRR